MDTFKRHAHTERGAFLSVGGNDMASGNITLGTGESGSNGSAETAPRHIAFYPRIHL